MENVLFGIVCDFDLQILTQPHLLLLLMSVTPLCRTTCSSVTPATGASTWSAATLLLHGCQKVRRRISHVTFPTLCGTLIWTLWLCWLSCRHVDLSDLPAQEKREAAFTREGGTNQTALQRPAGSAQEQVRGRRWSLSDEMGSNLLWLSYSHFKSTLNQRF